MSGPRAPLDLLDTNIPLYQALGLTRKESDDVYFAITQDLLPVMKTKAGVLSAIAAKDGWSIMQKVYAAYFLKRELLIKQGIPEIVVNGLGDW